MKKPACISVRDGLVLATIQYLRNFDTICLVFLYLFFIPSSWSLTVFDLGKFTGLFIAAKKAFFCKRTLQWLFSRKPFAYKVPWHMFRSSHFCFWFLVTFGNKVTKIRKYYVIFVYILQGKMGKTEKNRKKIRQLKWPKY